MQEIKLTQDKRLSKQYKRLAFFLRLKWGRDQIAGLNKLGGICCLGWYDHDQIADIFIMRLW